MTRPRFEFVFDLDDTLYKERDYVRSCFRWIGARIASLYRVSNPAERLAALFEAGTADPIGQVWRALDLPETARAGLIAEMRAHRPEIRLDAETAALVAALRQTGRGFSIVTDGRSVTQRAKLTALGLTDARMVCISEEIGATKPDTPAFARIAETTAAEGCLYVGDNPAKDFMTPNRLGWLTVQLADDGRNIHRPPHAPGTDSAPAETIASFDELRRYL